MKLIWDAPQELKTDRKFEEIILPKGVYTFTITKAEFAPDQYQVDKDFNKDGMSLKMWLNTDFQGHNKRVFATIGIHKPHIINTVILACNLPPLKRGGSLNEQSLVDVEIKAKISQYTSKVGKVSNIVDHYLPAHPAGHQSGHA
ncbi:MAG: hypothetical protein EBY29_13625, partial [Planctomycetes bacterium]|nr:hypothetical protein [Planctomycetota bacterium]